MKEIKFKRIHEWFNRNFEYEILINHDEILELSSGQEKMVELDSPVTIQARLWWCGSRKIELNQSLENISSISVQANRLTHTIAVVVIPLIFIACSLLNILFSGYENIIMVAIISCMALCLGLLTIWRKTWLKLTVEQAPI